MNIIAILVYTTALAAVVLAALAMIRLGRSFPINAFVGGMFLFALESAFVGLSLNAVSSDQIRTLQMARFFSLAFIPVTWLLFSLSYSRGNYSEFFLKWRLLITSAVILPIGWAALFYDQLILRVFLAETTADWVVELRWPGLVLEAITLFTSVLILMNLERTFMASVGTMRWRIKFMILGVALIFGVRIYTSSQVILYSCLQISWEALNLAGLGLGCVLMGWSLVRSGRFRVEVYPSQAVLSNSLTVVLAGIYLTTVGVIAQIVTALGGDTAFQLKAFLVLVALVGLAALLMSDRLRQRIQRFVSRHLKRPIYNYRQIWTNFTACITSLLTEAELCRKSAYLISQTLELLSVSIWLLDKEADRLVLGGSTSLDQSAGERSIELKEELVEAIRALAARREPIDIDRCRDRWVNALKDLSPHFFPEGGNRLCMSLNSGGEQFGVMIVGDRVNGISFSTEDMDLLKCMGEQVAAYLRGVQLSKRLLQAKEMEAFQTISAFFVHDLKNTVSTLSLMLKNLPKHFDNPEFRQDALRAISRSVKHITDLISRLSLLRNRLEINLVETDLNEIVASALGDLTWIPDARLVKVLRPIPKISADPEKIQKVVTNLLLNARDAIDDDGEIRLLTGRRNGWVYIEVADNGCGMAPEFVNRSLFRPFQTTKKNGLGIGMYQSKMIVESHGGKIEVRSQTGKGSEFRILLPLFERAAA